MFQVFYAQIGSLDITRHSGNTGFSMKNLLLHLGLLSSLSCTILNPVPAEALTFYDCENFVIKTWLYFTKTDLGKMISAKDQGLINQFILIQPGMQDVKPGGRGFKYQNGPLSYGRVLEIQSSRSFLIETANGQQKTITLAMQCTYMGTKCDEGNYFRIRLATPNSVFRERYPVKKWAELTEEELLNSNYLGIQSDGKWYFGKKVSLSLDERPAQLTLLNIKTKTEKFFLSADTQIQLF